jgi:uncharacterized membrane protein YdjX (TVP38/TMEM64 family)
MKLNNKYLKRTASVIIFLSVVAFFIYFSYLASEYEGVIRSLIISDFFGIIVYVFLLILESVIAPLSFIPLIAVASNLWGPFLAGTLNLIAWTIGASIIFFISRKYGKGIIAHFFPLEKISKIESRLPEEHVLLNIILLRIFVPADLLSYALSLLTKIKFRIYLLGTIIGLIPFSYIIAYLGVVKTEYQVLGFVMSVLILSVTYYVYRRKRRK